jgi:hypothetical protein
LKKSNKEFDKYKQALKNIEREESLKELEQDIKRVGKE